MLSKKAKDILTKMNIKIEKIFFGKIKNMLTMKFKSAKI